MIEQLLPIPVGVAAEFYAAAWKRMVDDFLRQWSAQSGKAFVPFDAVHDYHLYLDGKLRIAGTRLIPYELPHSATRGKDSELAGARDTIMLQLLS